MTHHTGSDEGLTGDEIDTLVYESGPDAYHDAMVQEVERILAARAAAPDALADAWNRGYAAGFSNAMRRMSDEPIAPTSPNPFLAERPTDGAGT